MNLINLDTLITSKRLTVSEEYLLDFINTSPDFFCEEKITNIAKAANVSTASVTRLAKKLGFDSLKHLQVYVLYKKNYIRDNYEIIQPQNLKSMWNNLKTYHSYAINETYESLDLNKVQNLINDLVEANKIMIYGTGSSHTVALELGLNLQKIGIEVIHNQSFHQQLLNLPTLKPDDHLLLFSKSGEGKEIQFLIEQGFKQNIPVSIITSNSDLTNYQKIKNLVTFVSQQPKERISSISSKMAQFMVIDLIFAEIFNHQESKNQIMMGNKITKEWNEK